MSDRAGPRQPERPTHPKTAAFVLMVGVVVAVVLLALVSSLGS